MRIGTKFGWRSFVVISTALLLMVGCAPRLAPGNQNQPQPAPPAASAQERETEYRREVTAILAPYFAQQQAADITRRLLALTVPARFQDLHLQLVLAFSRFDTARTNGDADAAEEAAAQLDAVVVKYPWVRGTPAAAAPAP